MFWLVERINTMINYDLDNDKIVKIIPIMLTKWLGRTECRTITKSETTGFLQQNENGEQYINLDIEKILNEYNDR